jgi:fructokinase
MSRVVCFGETLWDLAGDERFLGGAPLNVAYHLRQLGVQACLVSAVGRDAAGDDALARIDQAGIDATFVRRHPHLPTGTARVSLSPAGEPAFTIADPVAWDEISDDGGALAASLAAAGPPRAIVYGTLALRRQCNRDCLSALLFLLRDAWAVCDLNLRRPFDDIDGVDTFIRRATMLKVNEVEARRLAPSADGDEQRLAFAIQEQWGVPVVCVTRGPLGAGLVVEGQWWSSEAPATRAVDPVGAGDAFTAALLAGALASPDASGWHTALPSACRLGAFVASQRGAQPQHHEHSASTGVAESGPRSSTGDA